MFAKNINLNIVQSCDRIPVNNNTNKKNEQEQQEANTNTS